MVMFHSYVNLPEGMFWYTHIYIYMVSEWYGLIWFDMGFDMALITSGWSLSLLLSLRQGTPFRQQEKQ